MYSRHGLKLYGAYVLVKFNPSFAVRDLLWVSFDRVEQVRFGAILRFE